MNLPNVLTISRLFWTLIFAAFAQLQGVAGAAWAIVFFSLASLTDFLDGYIARKYNLITPFGKIMDPIADKCLTLTAMFVFAYEGTISLTMVMLIAVREILVTTFRIHAITRGQVLEAEKEGKIKTVVQIATIAVILLYRLLGALPSMAGVMHEGHFFFLFVINGFMIGATTLTLWSGFLFFRSIKDWKNL